MLEVLLTAIPSLCWMLFRCYQLFNTPTHKLGSSLNLDIPNTPQICIDTLDSSSIVLHWDIETLPDENIFYVILINGKDAGTLARNAVKLTNLDSNFLYKLQIVAINVISNFRSQSDAIYVRTLPDKNHMEPLTKLLNHQDFPISPELVSGDFKIDISVSEINSLSDESTLRKYMYALQADLIRMSSEFSVISSVQQSEEESIKNEIKGFKKELHDGSEARAKKEGDLKQLEQKKDLLTFIKLKLMKQLKNHTSQRNLNINKLAELRLKISKLSEKKHHVQNAADSERDKTCTSVQVLNENINELKGQIQSVEDLVKEANLEKKDYLTTLNKLRPLVEQFTSLKSSNDSRSSQDLTKLKNDPIFNSDGGLTDTGKDILEKIYILLPEWAQSINNELETLHVLESSWKNTFRLSLRKYLSVYNGLEALKAAADPLYVPKRKSEHKASIEFGGHAYALPKPIFESGDPDSSSEFNEALADNWYDLSRPNHDSAFPSSQVPVVGTQPLNEVQPVLQDSFLAQQEYPEFEQYNVDSNTNISQDGWGSHSQLPVISLPQHPQTDVYPSSIIEPSIANGPQIFGSNYADMQSMNMVSGRQMLANALSPGSMKQTLSQSSQISHGRMSSDYSEPHYLSPEAHTTYQPPTIQQSMFPYGDPAIMGSSPPETSFLYPNNQSSHLLNTLWNNNSQGSFVESRMQFLGLNLPKNNQLSPTISQQSTLANDRLYMNPDAMYSDSRILHDTKPVTAQSQFGDSHYYNDNILLNHNGLINNFAFPQSSIWLEKPMRPSTSHNRTVSSSSQLWRNDIQRPHPTTNEFSPFLQMDNDLESMRKNNDNLDIRLI